MSRTISLRTGLRLATVAVFAVVLGVSVLAQFSFGGLSARVYNDTNKAASATLLYTHTYAGNTCSSLPATGGIPATSAFTCGGSIAPTAPTPATGTVTATDSIAYRGTTPAAQVTQQVSASSCAPVALANDKNATNPLLTRYGTTFAPTAGPRTGMGAITLDGASPGGYETSVAQQSLTIPGLGSATYGYGIWFNVSAGSGPLFGFGASPANAVSSNDRVLYLTTAGKLAFVGNTIGTTVTQSTATDYRDGHWHFAYVRIVVGALGASMSANVYVDGGSTAVATAATILNGPSSYNGYWHVGWSPASGAASYLTGSLSNFVVFATSPAPVAPTTTDLASVTSFESWSSAASERYRLNDTGTATYTGTLPGNAANPCTTVNMNWGFTNPVSCGYSPTSSTAACTTPPAASLANFANGTARTIASPAPKTTQTSTVTTARGTGYSTTFAPGLHLFAPLTFTATRGGWVNSFTWNSAASAFIA